LRIVAVSDFSGLTSSACALASAAASAATDSLHLGMGGLHRVKIEAHCSRLRPLPSYPMPVRLPDVVRHQGLELAFGPLMVEEGLPCVAEQGSELGPGIRRAHIDDADRLDARPRRLGIDEMGRFTGLDAAPELLLRRDQDTEVKWVHRNRDFDPL